MKTNRPCKLDPDNSKLPEIGPDVRASTPRYLYGIRLGSVLGWFYLGLVLGVQAIGSGAENSDRFWPGGSFRVE